MLSWIGNLEYATCDFIFLDRDGVINRDRPDYVKNWGEFQFYPDSLAALQWLHQHHVGVVVVSNQSALNRGYMGWDSFWAVHHAMIAEVRRTGGDILAAYYCPHRPDEGCCCRKPLPELVLSAARTLGADPTAAAMIGDRQTDLVAARKAGCRAVLIERPDALAEFSESGAPPADFAPAARFSSLWEAVQGLYS